MRSHFSNSRVIFTEQMKSKSPQTQAGKLADEKGGAIPEASVPWLDEAHTTVSATRPGVVELHDGAKHKINYIDPPAPFPMRAGLRFSLNEELLGKLERLARSRFEISELRPGLPFTKWKPSPGQFHPEIAQSVNASSAIEDEGIAVEELRLLLTAATETRDAFGDEELQKRRTAIKSIYEAQIWALSEPYKDWVSFDFVLELHSRMFATTKREAGQIKTEPVNIHGAGYSIDTLPVEKTEQFLRNLCERTNKKFEVAHRHAEASMFLTCAEFIVDFLAIHPFQDGNGRVARLLSTYLLERAGYHFARFYDLDSIIFERRAEYYAALYNAQKRWYKPDEDLTPWIHFYVSVVFNQWERAYRRVREESSRKKSRAGGSTR